jgi:preprotein translocase SecE subunit
VAEDKKASSKAKIKTRSDVKSTIGKASIKKPVKTMRQASAKSRANAAKPKRVRKAAEAAGKPVNAVGKALATHYHLNVRTDKHEEKFFSKTRSLTPIYFKNAWLELRQVTWTGFKETWRLVFAVFIFAIVMGASIAVLDYGLEKLLREVIL